MRQRLAEKRKAVVAAVVSAVVVVVAVVSGVDLSPEAQAAVGLAVSALIGLVVHETPNAPSS